MQVMKVTIYIDIVILENIIINYIILLATGLILKTKINHIRLLLASLIGAIYTIISYTNILKGHISFVLKIILSFVIVYIAFNPQNLRKLWKDILFFYLTSFVFGGAAFALLYIVRPQDILMKNGLFLGTYPLKTVILGATIAFGIVVTAFTIAKNKITKKDMFCEIEIKINNQIIKTEAMIDTGNFLKEPITGTPVVVVEKNLLYESVPKEILNNLEEIIGGDFEKVPEKIRTKYISKLKLIPFSSLGKQNGMLIGIKPEYLKVKQDEQEEIKKDVIIGIYEKQLTKKGEYRALMGIDLI